MFKCYIKRYIWLFVVLTLATFSLFFFLGGHYLRPNALAIWGDVGKTVAIVTFCAVLFEKWMWKLPISLKFLVRIPCLEGLWKGNIRYKMDGCDAVYEKPVSVEIRQSLFNIMIETKTDESSSRSICASFNIDDSSGLKLLVYSYLNIPKQEFRDSSHIHYGSTLFEVGKTEKTMEGYYWTDRKTRGDITIEKVKDQ